MTLTTFAVIAAFAGDERLLSLILGLILGYALLVVVHECGHAVAAIAMRAKVLAVEISAVGGAVWFQPPSQPWRSTAISSAGIVAQVALAAATLAFVHVYGRPSAPFASMLVFSFTIVNAIVALINIVPFKLSEGLESDGYHIWRSSPKNTFNALPPEKAPIFPPETSLLNIPSLVPCRFTIGVEILSDRTTPMELVVGALMRHLDLTREEAVLMMLRIHNEGGALVPLPTLNWARDVADGITEDARRQGHALICRAVDAQQAVQGDGPASGGSAP